ncbi:hypothetical protein F2Q69_00026506 [Brassica cretica]|uniref:Glucose-methanol-choline oxidoreductase C-terminal domain-containing protein n=1 Tax=Brassica cretica TaxID=69181 RepID=A0A8S9S2B8_BRACR|nr:hypothetical protein F2Q69_00026506 [Brassica cretica]
MHDNPMNAVFIPSPVPVEVSLIVVVGITGEGTYVEAAGGENFGGGVNLRPPRSGPGASLPPSAEEFCQHTVTTIWHYHGGCVVGRVVDGDYKVIGIDRLRVIDISDGWLLSWYKSSSHGYDAWQVYGCEDHERETRQ